MNRGNEIREELKNMGSILADMPCAMPYSVPEGFFENFTGSVQATIKYLNSAEKVPEWGRTMPYTIPNGYFNQLTGKIVAKAIADGDATELTKNTPFKVPAGYFETLPAQMLAAAKAAEPVTKKTRVIPLKSYTIFREVKWAAAAVFVLGICFGSYRIFNSRQANAEKMLASVSSNDIQDYVQHNYRLDADRIVTNKDISNLKLDNKDIIQYLNETGWD